MIVVNLDPEHPDRYQAAAELDRLTAAARGPRRPHVVQRVITGAAVALLALLAAAYVAGPSAPATAPCGYVAEDHAGTVPASCRDLAELDAELDRIHAERSGGRFVEVAR